MSSSLMTACGSFREALASVDPALLPGADCAELAEEQTPGAEAVLLPEAGRSDLSALRERAREHRQAGTDPAELRSRRFAAREFRSWSDRDGMVHSAGSLPPERGLPFVRRIEAAAAQAARAGKAAGSPVERFPAHAADAVVDLVAGGQAGAAEPPRAELVLVCDLYAYRRGHAHPGEVCHMIGGGPIPVEVLKDLAADAFVKTVLHDGTAIRTVKHFGRHLPAPLRTALDLGPVPEFTGRRCVDCGRRFGLEYDHIDPVAHQGPTSYDNLAARCWVDHHAKTERDRAAGLLRPGRVATPGPTGSA